MAVAVNANLVACVRDRLHLSGKCLDGVTRNEPGGPDAETLEQVEKARATDLACKQAARNIVRRVLATIGAEPARHRVDVDAKPDENFLGHESFPSCSCCREFLKRVTPQ